MREGFAEIHTRLDKIEARLDKIEKRLDRFERKFDVLTSDIVDLRVRVSDIEPKPN
jgi:tetrahydromethanopterin S-methyltransferase subunit G